MFAILRKDFAAQFATVATASAVALTVLGLLIGQRLIEGDEILLALRPFVLGCLLPIAWLLVNRLFVIEYTRGGSGLLDRLPLGRGRIFVAKVVLSAPFLLALLALGLSSILSGGQVLNQKLPPEQVARVFGESASFLTVVYSALVLGATLGRHRHSAWLLTVGGLLVAWRAGVPLVELGPLAYLGQDPLTAPSLRWLGISTGLPEATFRWLGISAGLLATAFALTTIRKGRLARAWQRPSDRRDVMVWAILATLLAGALAGTGVRQPPFVLDGPIVQGSREYGGGAVVTVRNQGLASQALADDTALYLAELETQLGITPPSVSIDLSRSVDGETFERATLPGRSGLLVRIGPLGSERDQAQFRAWILHHALDEATRGRLRRGSGRLILDGYPLWLALQEASPKTRAREALRAASAVRSLEGSPVRLSQGVSRWKDVRRQVGDPLARSLGAWILSLAAAEDVHALARHACDERLGSFGGLGDDAEDFTLRLRAAGIQQTTIENEAVALVASQREALSGLPSLAGSGLKLEVGPPSELGHALVFTPGRSGAGRVALLHALAGGDSLGDVPRLADREEAPRGAPPFETSRRYPAGARVVWTFAAYVPALGCDLVLGWREVTVP